MKSGKEISELSKKYVDERLPTDTGLNQRLRTQVAYVSGYTDGANESKKEIEALVSALENLYSEQNGCPLERRRNQWEAAMKEAQTVLFKYTKQ